MKAISLSLFNDCEKWEFNYYLRGVYFNLRMAKLLLPDWEVVLTIHQDLVYTHHHYFEELNYLLPFETETKKGELKRCEAMLWRVDALYLPYVDKIICRDTDALITYRDAMAVKEWEDSGCVGQDRKSTRLNSSHRT